MSENINPATTPANAGQVPGEANKPVNNTPAADGQGQPQGGQGESKIELSAAEVEKLKRDAGRWQKHIEDSRKARRNSRRENDSDYQDLDGADPKILEALRSRDEKLHELSLNNRTLAVKDRVRDLFDSEEYKNIPAIIRKAIIRNPLGFVNSASETLDDAIADIQDYLDDELDNPSVPSTSQSKQEPQKDQSAEHQVPQVSGSGPASPNAAADADIAGKTGSARSTAILSNLLKNRK